jgi:hypothetical protein
MSALAVTRLRSRGARSGRSQRSRNRTSVVYCTTPGATFPVLRDACCALCLGRLVDGQKLR